MSVDIYGLPRDIHLEYCESFEDNKVELWWSRRRRLYIVIGFEELEHGTRSRKITLDESLPRDFAMNVAYDVRDLLLSRKED